jgi:predicted CXXCH cytochrome family protein
MADEQKRTQKQVAQKYKDNLDYYRKPHPFRRARLILFVCTVILTLMLSFGFNTIVTDRKAEAFFNTGPLSKNHSNLSENCQACHWGATPDFAHLVQLGNVVSQTPRDTNPAIEKIRVALLKAKGQGTTTKEHAKGLLQAYTDLSALEKMDVACIACHVNDQRMPVSLHCPQSANLQLAKYTPEILVVESGTCSTCHREHQGPAPMPLPDSTTACAVCHNDGKVMTALVQGGKGAHRVKITDAVPVLAAQNSRTREGIIRFLVPDVPGQNTKPFKTYSSDHPPFGYESAKLARDGSHIRYNHQRHEQPDVIGKPGDKFNTNSGKPMRCDSCHTPGADGVLIQRVSYEKHCQSCHSLDIVMDDIVPPIVVRVPHRDTEKVHVELSQGPFTSSIRDRISETKLAGGARFSDEDIRRITGEAFGSLKRRGMNYMLDLQRRVFYTGDPPQDDAGKQRILGQKALASCVKCHEITPERASMWDGAVAPKMTPTDIPDRWVNHGPFTHRPHKHMQCEDCHASEKDSLTSAKKSSSTADILMPKQALCAECHRPPTDLQISQRASTNPQNTSSNALEKDAERAARQRKEGGIKWDCQDCHRFHAPAEALKYAPGLAETK